MLVCQAQCMSLKHTKSSDSNQIVNLFADHFIIVYNNDSFDNIDNSEFFSSTLNVFSFTYDEVFHALNSMETTLKAGPEWDPSYFPDQPCTLACSSTLAYF